MQICLSMSDLFLPPGLKRLRCFPACYKFLEIALKSGLNLGLKKNKNGSSMPRCISSEAALVYYKQLYFLFLKKDNHMVHFRLYLKQYCAWQICQIACRSVIEALNISSELQFPAVLTLVCTQLQYLFNAFILPKSVYLLL